MQSPPGECEKAVRAAISAGYRLIDTASLYGNEADVGRAVRAAIADGVVRRDEMFVITKLGNFDHLPEQVRPACERSIAALGLGPIDLYLLHTPMAFEPETTDYVDTWLAMEELLADGLVRALGVSNFNREQLRRILRVASVRPVTNQVECSPNLALPKLREFQARHNIVLIAYGPLTRPHRIAPGQQTALSDPLVLAMGKKYKKTAAQICLRFMVSARILGYNNVFMDLLVLQIMNGTVPIPKSVHPERIAENIGVFDFRLTDDEMTAMRSLDRNLRMCPFTPNAGHRNFMFDEDEL